MDKESRYLLQCLDSNCNDCKHLGRLFGEEAKGITDVNGKTTGFLGHCMKKNAPTVFIPATNAMWNGELGENCFKHRLDP